MENEMLKSVIDIVGEQAPPEDFPVLSAFVEAYIRRFPDTDGVRLTPRECYDQIEDLYGFIKKRLDRAGTVRVFVPDRSLHGYETGASVVEVIVDDGPFLVDSITAEIQARGIAIKRALHPVIGVDRDEQGNLTEVMNARGARHKESVQHYELDRALDDDEAADLETGTSRSPHRYPCGRS